MYWAIIKLLICKNKILCAVGIILIGICGCSSNSEPKPKPVPDIERMENISVNWDDSDLEISPAGSFVPVVDNNAIFTADSQGNIFRIDQTDGTIINHYHYSHNKFMSGTAVDSNSIFVTTTDGYLLSLNKANGKIKWRSQLPTISIEAPQVGGDTVVVRTNDAQVLAYNANDGSLIWVYQKPTPPLTLRAYTTFQVIGKDVVLIGQPGGRLALVNLGNGVAIWENYVAIPEGATDLDKLTDVSTRPVINEKEICVATFNGKIACLDAISSSIIWSKNFSTSYGVLVDDQNVYSVSQDGVLYAYDKNTGGKVWSNDTLQYRQVGIPVFLNNNILIVDGEGYVNLFNRNDGKMVARRRSELKNGVAYPWSDGKKAVVQSGNGHIEEITQ